MYLCSLRPFLEDIEKRWIAFQLLSAVRDCHARNIFHGDIKTENMLLTSWNWLYLTDFSASFKPTYLPEDNPADYSFYFDISGRRTCYLAPERFLSPDDATNSKGGLTWAMDIFSAGCVIAELFVEGPIFNLSQLFRYRNGEYEPKKTILQRIEDEDIREMVAHMINVDPESRYSADEYLNFWRQKSFPEYFYNFMHQYMHLMSDPSSGRAEITAGKTNLGESDDRIDRLYYDFDKIAYFLGYDDLNEERAAEATHLQLSFSMFPLHLDIPGKRTVARLHPTPNLDDGTLLFLDLALSSCRSTARTSGKIRACELLLAFSLRLPDDARLDRILPFLIDLLKDSVDTVRAAALRTMAQLLALITITSPANANIFPEYVFHYISKMFTETRSTLVRVTLASCLGPFAQAALHLLDVNFALKSEGSMSSRRYIRSSRAEDGSDEDTFDIARGDLVRFFETHTRSLLDDPDPDVRRALLGSVPPLCVFFGSTKASDVILVHINTYLNDANFQLKCAFFETVVGVATYVGGPNLEEYILPLMLQSLTDAEEAVVEKCIRSLGALADLGLFQRSCIWYVADLTARFTMHPNQWIREATSHLLSAATKYITPADVECIIKPLVAPYLRRSLSEYTATAILDGLKKPLSRIVFDMALTWATRAEKGSFWKPGRLAPGPLEDQIAYPSSRDLCSYNLQKMCRHQEDQQWLERLKTAGLSHEDDLKLIALKEYIYKTVHSQRPKADEEDPSKRLNKIIPLKDLQIAPETVFFGEYAGDEKGLQRSPSSDKPLQTIQDALLDASTTVTAPLSSSAAVSREQSTARSAARAMKTPGAGRVPSPIVAAPYSSSPLRHGNSVIDEATEMARQGDKSAGKRPVTESPIVGSPSNDSDAASVMSSKQRVKSRSSAMDLMQMQKQSKAAASTEASVTTAEARIDSTHSRDLSPRVLPTIDEKKIEDRSRRNKGAHTYTGRDPAVLRLLDTLYLDNFPSDFNEFGARVTPVERRPRDPRYDEANVGRSWRPDGTLVAMLGEHTAAINSILASPDHSFFITGSDDGSIRIWDTSRLERNISQRSRQVYRHEPGAKVTALCFIEHTHSFVSAASDGSIHIVRVDVSPSSSGTKYGKLRLLRKYQLPATNSQAIALEHYRHESMSILMVVTSASTIHAIDIRSMTPLFTLSNPLHHGSPTSFCTDGKHHWLLLGTSHGVLDLWDLRFRIRVRSFAFPAASPIHSVRLHPVRGSRKRSVLVAGGTGAADISVWDLEKLQCKEVYRTAQAAQQHTAAVEPRTAKTSAAMALASLKPYAPWFPDAQSKAATLGAFAKILEEEAGKPDRGVRCLTVGTRASLSDPDRTEPRHGFFLAAGPDRKVRFWDMDHVESSIVVSGLEFDETQPSYMSSLAGTDCVVCEESVGGGGKGKSKTGSGAGSGGGVVSLQQQRLLKSHLDTVTALALVEWPGRMVVSGDRMGVVFVFS